MANYANIIVDRHHQRVDQVFTYRIPEAFKGTLLPGMTVEVPFGKGNQTEKAYVLELTDSISFPPEKAKDILRVLGGAPVFTPENLQLAGYMKKRFAATLSSCLALFVPREDVAELRTQTRISLCEPSAAAKTPKEGSKKARFLEMLTEHGGSVIWEELPEKIIARGDVRALAEAGFVTETEETEKPEPGFAETGSFASELPPPTGEQTEALSRLLPALKKNEYKSFLLHGVTGSGKTYIYMRMIEDVIRAGRQAVLLVPEISLTPQLVEVLQEHFGERIGVLHSRLTDKERSRRWLKAKLGFYDVILGARSALFAPLPDLGLIVLDEEHENSYQSDEMPRYHAREVAEELCRIRQIPLVMGSATPSVESYYKAKNGESELIRLKERATGAKLPTVDLVDLREENAAGNMGIFSARLQNAMAETLKSGKQTLLFLNRRGFANFAHCRECGFVLRCPNCYIPYTYHLRGGSAERNQGVLICHSCGKTVAMPSACPHCKSPFVRVFGIGTQRVEEEAKKLFPSARVARMDLNKASSEINSYEETYEAMRRGEIDILVGTQMIVKGFDFPNVTLVGIVSADMGLNGADYHCAERTFELLTQAAGRAGRADSPGRVILQSYTPEHYAIVHALKQDYEGFYEEEIENRRLMQVSPFAHMVQLLISSKNEDAVRADTNALYQYLKKNLSGDIRILGPTPALKPRVDNHIRWSINLKGSDEPALTELCEMAVEDRLNNNAGSVLSISLDPLQLQ